MQPVLIVQGGAGGPFRNSCRAARIRRKLAGILEISYKKLVASDALEAVTCAVKLLEDDPEFNAGTGSQLQADGRARLSASIMDGARLRFAAVVNLEAIKNPIGVARALLEEEDRVLAGEGALRFARQLGLKSGNPRTKESIRWWKKYQVIAKRTGDRNDHQRCDTVGASALDRFGNLASATSTGGRGFERPGRVSDSAMPVANYADERCAVTATGVGEEIMEEGLAIKIAARVQDRWPTGGRSNTGTSILSRVFKETFAEIRSRGRRMGAVGLDRKGNCAWQTTTEVLIWGWRKGKQLKLF